MSHDIVLWDLSVDFKPAEYSWTLTVFAETVLLRHNNVTDRKESNQQSNVKKGNYDSSKKEW